MRGVVWSAECSCTGDPEERAGGLRTECACEQEALDSRRNRFWQRSVNSHKRANLIRRWAIPSKQSAADYLVILLLLEPCEQH